ncbi:DUF456 domain-containing protein [Galbibacter sp. BG1]|uniref:DUF456 domain-containing protein n=1 Tax=Galbibacter sp. BG1 TaxID=1170699 RepID=UPI0015B8BE7F|nr:DUF456 domain-containing protein [Galbibacter sp. BG1]QLE00987.1 DUF456 domain-containing protein [Galbibacter sp. BG1]
MDVLLVTIGFVCIIIGFFGSFLPILPGAPISWVGLLLLYLTKAIPTNWWMLGITLFVAIAIIVLDYLIPIAGTKRFGGSRAGIIGTTVGLVVSIIFPVLGLFGVVVWPFVGAFVGELINKADRKTALRAAFGSFLGFLTGTFLKFVVAVIFSIIFMFKVWEYRSVLFL